MADILEKKRAKRLFRSNSLPALAGTKTASESTSVYKDDLDLLVEFESTSVSLITLNKLKLELEEALGIRVDVVHSPVPDESILQIKNVLRII